MLTFSFMEFRVMKLVPVSYLNFNFFFLLFNLQIIVKYEYVRLGFYQNDEKDPCCFVGTDFSYKNIRLLSSLEWMHENSISSFFLTHLSFLFIRFTHPQRSYKQCLGSDVFWGSCIPIGHTRQIHNGGPPQICGQQDVEAPPIDNTGH